MVNRLALGRVSLAAGSPLVRLRATFAACVLGALCLAAAFPCLAAAQQATEVAVRVPVQIAPGGRPNSALYFSITPRPGVRIVSPSPDSLAGAAYAAHPLFFDVDFRVAAAAAAPGLELATVLRVWQDGRRDSTVVRAPLPPAGTLLAFPAQAARIDTAWAAPPQPNSAAVDAPASTASSAEQQPRLAEGASDIGGEWLSTPIGGLTKEVEVELYGTSRSAAPGGLVTIRYNIMSFEETDEHVRLRLQLPDGWVLLDRDTEERRIFLEAWEEVEGEIRVLVPRSARVGQRELVRLIAAVEGEPGGAAVHARVQVVRSGGLQAGQVGLTGTASVQATSFGVEDLAGARYGGVVDLSSRLSRESTLTLNYRQGPRESTLTNYRIAQEETRWSGNVRRPTWTLQFGNQLGSSGSVIAGPYVRGQGVALRRTQGLLQGDLTVAQPTSFIGDPGGHLVRGSGGIAGKRGRLLATVSDFGRPVGGYSTAPRYPEDIDPDSLERLERERRALANAARNRVQGAGLDSELRLGASHRLVLRGGWLRLHNAAGDTIADASAEGQYSFSHRRATLNARWRQMPNSLQGISLPGNETSLDGSVKVLGEWRLAGRAYRTSSHTQGNGFQSAGEGASAGVRWARERWRMDVQGSYREWSYGGQPTVARTVNASFGVPVGALGLSGFASVGEQQRDTLRQPTASYRGDLRWSGKAGTASWSASYYETLNSPPRLRTDLLGSLRLGDWELAGGAWASRGLLRGGEPGVWTQVGVPASHDLLLSLGIEYAPPGWGRPPQWLGTVGFRRKVVIPLPFLRDGSVQRQPAAPLSIPGGSGHESR
jgi:hypothetical protein